MKTIKIRVEGGVVQEVTIPKEYEHLIDYEVIDLDTEEPNAAPPDEEAADAAPPDDKPEEGKVYALTGGPGSRCIANGHSWKDSVVGEDK
jgi:hypothetical protein|tara:strand:- start:161 stop:430 length:270 start_codon:yes stop_codon:yes gene_type:complete